MASVLKLLLALLLLHIVAEIVASQPCDLTSIQVQQTNTGAKVGYDPVFEVEVKNLCRCSVASVFLRSEGFASSKLVDPKLFRRAGNDYLVNDGKSIQSSLSVKFSYAWDRAFRMSAESFQIQEDCK
ncbi:TPD1 protein homolog 1-like [Curcuma longa]|uniref:TPD1 protein homolog 1-like n=1 Tax=Curcuma longa TaxID=136217 RepID=UPI003D9F04A2